MTLTALVVVLAVTAALVYNRVAWRPRQASGRASQDGVSIAGIIGPLGTLAVLLLVFVLVQTYASWSAAGEAETAEATATLLLFREADLVKDARTRNRLRAAVVCYATSVIRQEWPAMENRRVSSVPTYWGARIRETGVRLTRTSAEKNAGENLVARDGERASARQERLGEARPTVPGALFVLMVLAVAVTLGIVGVATERSVGCGVHAVIVVATGVVLAATSRWSATSTSPTRAHSSAVRARPSSSARRSRRRSVARCRVTTAGCRPARRISGHRRARSGEAQAAPTPSAPGRTRTGGEPPRGSKATLTGMRSGSWEPPALRPPWRFAREAAASDRRLRLLPSVQSNSPPGRFP